MLEINFNLMLCTHRHAHTLKYAQNGHTPIRPPHSTDVMVFFVVVAVAVGVNELQQENGENSTATGIAWAAAAAETASSNGSLVG